MEIMPILERKIAHKMTTLCSHITYPEFVLPLHKHAEYELMIFTHGSGKQFVGEGVAPYTEGDVALIGSNGRMLPILYVRTRLRFAVISRNPPTRASSRCWQKSVSNTPASCLPIQIWLSQKWLSVPATIRRLSSSSSFRRSSILLLLNIAGKLKGLLSDG